LVLLQENPFFYFLEQILVHLLVNQIIPTGGSTDVGTEYMHVIHFCPMLYIESLTHSIIPHNGESYSRDY
jgi:hypothetical protein